MPNMKVIALKLIYARSRAFILKRDGCLESIQAQTIKPLFSLTLRIWVESCRVVNAERGGDAARGSILYSILKRGAPRRGRQLERAAARRPWCTCASACKLVTLRAPVLMFTAASQVLAKTFRFLKNVACFRGLPAGDQRLLVRHRWAPLLVVGLVQDSVHFDTVETRRPSLLHTILTRHKKDTSAGAGDPGVPVGVAEGIQVFLVRCRGLGMSATEFALVKGALLFSAGRNQRTRSLIITSMLHF